MTNVAEKPYPFGAVHTHIAHINLRSGVPLFSRREGTPDTITWLFVCC